MPNLSLGDGFAVAVAVALAVGMRWRARSNLLQGSTGKALTPAVADESGYCFSQPKETRGFILQQTMLRVKDPAKSLDFYSRVLGMRLVRSFEFPEAKFSLYFLGYVDESTIPKDDTERKAWLFQQPAMLELTHNHGTEEQPDFKYVSGNVEPHRGFGHIGIDVPNLDEVSLNEWVKRTGRRALTMVFHGRPVSDLRS